MEDSNPTICNEDAEKRETTNENPEEQEQVRVIDQIQKNERHKSENVRLVEEKERFNYMLDLDDAIAYLTQYAKEVDWVKSDVFLGVDKLIANKSENVRPVEEKDRFNTMLDFDDAFAYLAQCAKEVGSYVDVLEAGPERKDTVWRERERKSTMERGFGIDIYQKEIEYNKAKLEAHVMSCNNMVLKEQNEWLKSDNVRQEEGLKETILKVPTLLHSVALLQEEVYFKELIKFPDIKDDPGEDGLTGFAIWLALKNKVIVSEMLKSHVQPKEDMIFLSEEVLKVPSHGDSDSKLRELQESIKSTFSSLGIENKQSSHNVRSSSLEQVKFPFVNPFVEEQDHYSKNKLWLKNEIALLMNECSGRMPEWQNSYGPNLTDIMYHISNFEGIILGKFCIESGSEDIHTQWDLRGIQFPPCRHKGDRFVWKC